MPSVRLRCDCGLSWDQPDPQPAAARDACPRCRPAPGPLRPGDTFGGFEVLAELSRGGMGAVYTARQPGLDRTVALKVILPGRAGTAAALARFEREVRAAARLSHPNIVTVFATDLAGPVPYLVMEYVPGIDLHRLVRKAGPLPVADAVAYTRQAADALQHAHEHGLVHRDVKPANLMVTPSPLDPAAGRRRPVVKVMDFGLARAGGDGGDLTRAGEFLGTPDYVSPEQAQDAAAADTRADLFSLGGTLYYLLAGEPPLPEGPLLSKLSRLLTEPPPSVRAKRPEVPDELDRVIRKLLARAPADRYQTPAELCDALDALVAAGLPGRAAGSSLTQTPPPRPTPPTDRLPAATVQRPPSTVFPGAATVVGPAVVLAHPGGVRAVAAAADGETLVTAGADGTLRAWDRLRLAERRRASGDVGAVTAAAVGPGGGWAVSAAVRMSPADIGVQVWDLHSGKETRRLTGPADNPTCLAVSGDGRRVAAGTADSEVWVWSADPAGGKPGRFRGHAAPLAAVVFLPGGDGLLSADAAGQVRQWDLRTGAYKGKSELSVGKLAGLAFGGLKGKMMAGCGTGGLVLRGRDGSVQPLAGHAGAVRAVTFSPDGGLLVSAGADGTVRLWAAADGRPAAAFDGFAGPATCVCWSACGTAVYAGGADGTVRRWPAPAG